jgi:hypothetical protein
MRPRPHLSFLISAVLVAASWTMPVSAQLTDVTWIETIDFQADGISESQIGLDDSAPENINATLVDVGYGLSGSVSHVYQAAPNAKSEIVGSYTSGLNALSGNCRGSVSFKIVVRETSAPPVSVSAIPVQVVASGSAMVTGDGSLPASADAFFRLKDEGGPLITDHASVNNEHGAANASFELDQIVEIAADVVIDGSFSAFVAITTGNPQGGSSSSGTAEVDPLFEIVDQLIPGSSASYRDHYKVEFANGWYALPTKETSWGEIKAKYNGEK